MLLAIDIGNTNITFGLYEGDTLGPRWRIRTIHDKMPDEYGILMDHLFRHRGYLPEQVTGVAIASVVPPLTPVFEQACRDYVGRESLVVDAGVKTGVSMHTKPRSSKKSRIALITQARMRRTAFCFWDLSQRWRFSIRKPTECSLGVMG